MSKKSRERKQMHLSREQAQRNDQKPPPAIDQSREIIYPFTPVRKCEEPDDGLKHPLGRFEPVPLEEVYGQTPCAPQPLAPIEPTPITKSIDDPNIPGIYYKQSTFREPPEAGKLHDFSHLVEDPVTVDAGKILKQCCTDMCNAMMPRTNDGMLLNGMSIGDVKQAKIPVVEQPTNPTRENPLHPLLHAGEFANGHTPDGLQYVDGYVECKEGPDGKTMHVTTFSDPVRGLSDQDRAALELGRMMQQSANASHHPFPKQEESTAEDNLAPDLNTLDMVIDRPQDGCLIYITKKGPVKLTNFRLVTLESRLIIGKLNDGIPTVEYLVQIICGSISRNITLTPQELDNAVRKIQNELPSCIVLPGVMKANQCITNYLRQQLMSAPQKVYVERTGFLQLAGVWSYVHDRAVPPDPNTVFNTGRYIPDRPGLSDAQAFHDALRFVDISHKDELILILFLLAHLGPLFQLFHEAGRTPRFVTILVGRSGSLKTSVSLILYRLFADQGRTPTATFKDTETALEIKLGQLGGTTGIFDDFRPPVSDLKSQVNAEKLESIIRAVGDHVSKARSTVKLDRAKEFVPSGCVLVTAEDLSGSHSSYLRSLILSISKGDIDGSKLRFFQNNPDIIPAHMNRFLRWIGQHGDEVINRIRFEYPAAQFENTVTELRLVDTAATLMMTAHLLASYAEACGAMTSEQAQGFLSRCYRAITTAIITSESMSKEANPCVMYLEAIFSMIDRGDIRLAENIKIFVPEIHDGFLSDHRAWLDTDAVYAKVTKYYSKMGITFPLKERQLAVHLADSQLIEVYPETRQDGSIKKHYRRKSSLSSRKAMQVLHLDLATTYLEENGNN